MAPSSGGREKSSGGGAQDLRVHGALGQKKRRNTQKSRNLPTEHQRVPTRSRTSVQRALLVQSLPRSRSPAVVGNRWPGLDMSNPLSARRSDGRMVAYPTRPGLDRGRRGREEWQTYIRPSRPTDMPAEFLSRERFRAQLRSGGRKGGRSFNI